MRLGLFSLLLLSPLTAAAQLTVNFQLQPLPEQIQLDVLRFYITQVIVEYENGEQYKDPTLAYLLDNEDPESWALHMQEAPKNPVKKIHFELGTDSVLNVAGVLEGALDPVKGMYWAWNTGYINFKLEGILNEKVLEYHIGGYRSPFTTSRSITASMQGPDNRIRVDIMPWIEKAQALGIDATMIPGEKAAVLADNFELIFTPD